MNVDKKHFTYITECRYPMTNLLRDWQFTLTKYCSCPNHYNAKLPE